jgi:hypothetical protein
MPWCQLLINMISPAFKLTSQRKPYQPVGRCIYCGDLPRNGLTLEHIIPQAIMGNFELPSACCAVCQVKINKFEQPCLRSMLGAFRATHGIVGRRRKKRPEKVPILTDYAARHLGLQQYPVAEYPKVLLLLRQPPAGILVGRADNGVLEPDIFFVVHDSHLRRLFSSHWNMGAMKQRDFCLTLAKIAHSYAVAERGYQDLKRNYTMFLPDYLLGHKVGHCDVVGGQPLKDPPAERGVLHTLALEDCVVQGKEYLIVHIRLFAMIGTPIYHVVFGERSEVPHTPPPPSAL